MEIYNQSTANQPESSAECGGTTGCGRQTGPWLHYFAILTALATFALIGIGGLVTSHEAGMSVPDWPNSYGYNMFLFPPSKWIGGIFYEHTHRLWATMVGLLVVALARWLGGEKARRPLAIIGMLEMTAGFALLLKSPHWAATGGFLTGIGGVVLLAALVWVRNAPAMYPLPQLGWLAFVLVQVQGLLGGLRVVLFKDEIGIFHALLAQLFFVLLCAIALLTGKWWKNRTTERSPAGPGGFILVTTFLIFAQLALGATMRHQHAGLSIPDFPLAYGKVWPDTGADAIARYNAQRIETTNVDPITAFQIELQMAHRILAVLILALVAFCAWKAGKVPSGKNGAGLRKLCHFWLGLILFQAGLGAATVLSHKAADVATAHVLAGALSLAIGAILSIISFQTGAVHVADMQCAPTGIESCLHSESAVHS